jgi:hypothetical protein
MRKRGLIVRKLRSCRPKGPTNSGRMRTIVTAALQYLQTELILWIRLVDVDIFRYIIQISNYNSLIIFIYFLKDTKIRRPLF